jgi:hypothetical protein
MTDINNSLANNPLATDPNALRVSEIYERQLEHIKLHGEVKRSDKKFWEELIETMTPQDLSDCCEIARDHHDWTHYHQDWFEEAMERSPFYIRTKSEKNKKCRNNGKIWHILMMMREMIDNKLKEQEDPRNKFFEFSDS